MNKDNKRDDVDNIDKKLHISDVRERLVNYIDARINYLSGDEMKSMNESITDSFIVKELEGMKKIINDDNF